MLHQHAVSMCCTPAHIQTPTYSMSWCGFLDIESFIQPGHSRQMAHSASAGTVAAGASRREEAKRPQSYLSQSW